MEELGSNRWGIRVLRWLGALGSPGRMSARPWCGRGQEVVGPLSCGRCLRAGWGSRTVLSVFASPSSRQPPSSPQNRPSVITCASASARNCNLSHCPIAHSGCVAGPASYRRAPSCKCPWGEGTARWAWVPSVNMTSTGVCFLLSHAVDRNI